MAQRTKHTAEEFVIAYMEAWKKGQTTEDLAETLGMTTHAISARKGRLKYNTNIELPDLKSTGWSRVPVKKLKDIVQDYEMGRR